MNKLFYYALIDLIAQNKIISTQTIIENARKGSVVRYIDDLSEHKFNLKNDTLKTLSESIKDYDFDAVDDCSIDFKDNGLLKLLTLIINYENL